MIINVAFTDGFNDCGGDSIGDDVFDIGDMSIEAATAIIAEYYIRQYTPIAIVRITESPRLKIAPGIILL